MFYFLYRYTILCIDGSRADLSRYGHDVDRYHVAHHGKIPTILEMSLHPDLDGLDIRIYIQVLRDDPFLTLYPHYAKSVMTHLLIIEKLDDVAHLEQLVRQA
jgi:hypothetical protein